MRTACFIPIKSNSERVPGKNFRMLNGKKLYEYICNNVIDAEVFDEIYIDTNSQEIADYAFKKGFLEYKHPDDFLFTTYLNIDQLMYSFSQEKFLLQCDKYYKQIKEIDAVCVIPELTKLNMVRAFRYSKKYKLSLSKFLKFIFECAKATPQELLELQEKHYHDNYLNKEEIKFFIKSLK